MSAQQAHRDRRRRLIASLLALVLLFVLAALNLTWGHKNNHFSFATLSAKTGDFQKERAGEFSNGDGDERSVFQNKSVNHFPMAVDAPRRPNGNDCLEPEGCAPPCVRGPYVWQARPCLGDGIGSTFQSLRLSLILADALRATWVGRLENSHDDITAGRGERPRRSDNAAFFGLGQDGCDADDMHRQHRMFMSSSEASGATHLEFWNVSSSPSSSTSLLVPPLSELCKSILSPWRLGFKGKHRGPPDGAAELRRKLNVTPNTVLVVGEDNPFHQDWSYCTFNHRFRKRFREARAKRRGNGNRSGDGKGNDEIWISAHFRWGDVKTGDVQRPDDRNQGSLSDLVHVVERWRRKVRIRRWWDGGNGRSRGRTIVHFFSEGPAATFDAFTRAFPDTVLHLDSERWREALDVMSNSDILIGGKSSFFVLGAHLCDECTVVAPHPAKFQYHMVEWEEAKHHDFRVKYGGRHDIPIPPDRLFFYLAGTAIAVLVLMLWICAPLWHWWCRQRMRSNVGQDMTSDCMTESEEEETALVHERTT